MVERVARGSILAPAAAILGAATIGLLKPVPATAASETTLQIRVQVVEACQIRLAPGGRLGELCAGSPGSSPLPAIEMPALAPARRLPSRIGAMPPLSRIPPILPRRDIDDANRRALSLAREIAERVGYVTLTF